MSTKSPPISVQLYSLREQAAKDFEGVLRRLGEVGFVGVELAGFHDLTPKAFAAIVEDAGLVTSSAHLTDLSPDGFNAALDDLQEIGCNVAVSAYLPPEKFADSGRDQGVRRCIEQGERDRQHRGVSLGYHNHWWEFQTKVDGQTAWSALIEHLDPTVFAEVDIYWAQIGGADPAAVIAELGERLLAAAREGRPVRRAGRARWSPSATGTIDIPAILHVRGPTAKWHIVELDRCATDMFDGRCRSYRLPRGAAASHRVGREHQPSRDHRLRRHQPRLRAHARRVPVDRDRGLRRRHPGARRGVRRTGTAVSLWNWPTCSRRSRIDAVVNLTPPHMHTERQPRLPRGRARRCSARSRWASTSTRVAALVELADAARVCVSAARPTRSSAPGLQTGSCGDRPRRSSASRSPRTASCWAPDPRGGTRTRRSSTSAAPGRCSTWGPYYLTALVQLLGPARPIAGSAKIGIAERVITSGRVGEVVQATTPTHVSSMIDFVAAHRDAGHQLRRAGDALRTHRGLRHRGHPVAARPEHVRRAGEGAQHPRRRLARRSRCRPPHPAAARHRTGRHALGDERTTDPIVRRPNSRCTCSS